ncbi:MAG TPA: cell division protein FtsZ [Candidatus Latescibacteria bacterium]|nr:cell division protein FtsZ [Candidatus Latescibacterota bacterium]
MTLSIGEDKCARMKVVGVGGAGGNAINRMISAQLDGVEFIAVNTDVQALKLSQAPQKVQIGNNLTRGLGTGGDPKLGRQAIEEDRDQMAELLKDTDMVFLTAGMGGGTGTGASPVIAELAKEEGALTVAIVTKPFIFEGAKRMRCADEGIAELKERVDTLIVIPNQRLLSLVAKETPLTDAFKVADTMLSQATKGISDLITVPGLINLDFNDVKAVMLETGDALMGVGIGRGDNRAVEAAQQAIRCPLLENASISGAKGILVNISGGENMTLYEINDATTVIYEEAGNGANIILGAVIDEKMEDEIRVTVIATGLNNTATRTSSLEGRSRILPRGKPWSVDVPTFIRNQRGSKHQGLLDKQTISTSVSEELELPSLLDELEEEK